MAARRVLFSCVVLIALVALAVVAIPGDAPAQSNVEDRVAALETEVAAQGDDISALRRRVRDLEQDKSEAASGNDEDTGAQDKPAATDGTTLSGSGETVSDAIRLKAGAYRITANVDAQSSYGGDGFAVVAYANGEYLDLIFNELIDANGPWSGSQVLRLDSDAEVYFEISNTSSAWTLTIEPL